MIGNRFKARYISDIGDDYLKKGQVYECWETKIPGIWGYTDNNGDNYGVPADRFELVDK